MSTSWHNKLESILLWIDTARLSCTDAQPALASRHRPNTYV